MAGYSRVDEIVVECVQTPTDEVRSLIGELDRTLAREYLPEQRHGLRVDTIFQPHVRFFVARLNGRAVGCGGVALFESFAEVKRMYVCDDARGRGVARALLSRIESETRSSGLSVLRLETGDRQFDAIRLYERAGFQRCDVFGEYATMPPRAIATSIFLEKHLALGRNTRAQ
jgi:putative acetyltransferase